MSSDDLAILTQAIPEVLRRQLEDRDRQLARALGTVTELQQRRHQARQMGAPRLWPSTRRAAGRRTAAGSKPGTPAMSGAPRSTPSSA